MNTTSPKKFSLKSEPVVIAESTPLVTAAPAETVKSARYVSPTTLLEQKTGAERLKKRS